MLAIYLLVFVMISYSVLGVAYIRTRPKYRRNNLLEASIGLSYGCGMVILSVLGGFIT